MEGGNDIIILLSQNIKEVKCKRVVLIPNFTVNKDFGILKNSIFLMEFPNMFSRDFINSSYGEVPTIIFLSLFSVNLLLLYSITQIHINNWLSLVLNLLYLYFCDQLK